MELCPDWTWGLACLHYPARFFQVITMRKLFARRMSVLLTALVAFSTATLLFSATEVKAQDDNAKYTALLKDAKVQTGLFKLIQKEGSLYAELTPGNLNKDYIVLTSIARGIGQGSLLGGMTWGFGDDWLWQFRKVEDKIHVVRRNVRFTAKKGSPEAKAVELAYTDSILFALPVVAKSPAGGLVVSLDSIFMTDLPQIGQVLRGFVFTNSRSTWSAVKTFKDNIELQVAATYASSGGMEIDTVPDSRGVTVNVHYSISELPNTGYQPRLADDRIGYFLTVIKDYSKQGDQDRFVRYINRWDLQKADPTAELSPPKKPIVFWLEKTVPFKYRKTIREGILEWNKAFEQAGFANAIEVRQQPDDADWDPEDINYNTFRWITSSAGFAMGPSRVNPITGQILDADIIFDADFLTFWKEEYEIFSPERVAAMTGGPLTLEEHREAMQADANHRHHGEAGCRCNYHTGFAREMAFGATAMLAKEGEGLNSAEERERMILQGLKEVVMHEVGHTLGLRHNFKASAFLTLEELSDPKITSEHGLTASVMDYTPTYLTPQGVKQGDYYSTTIGPYDMWAIEYGYKTFAGNEEAELKKIASRSGEKGLDYATDEDTRGIDSDPLSNRFDMSADPIAYAAQRAKLINSLWPGLVERVTKEGDGYQQARRAFGILLSNHGQSAYYVSRFIGGVYVHRDHRGDKDARPPFVVVEADKQREALAYLEKEIFSTKPFEFPPELYNYLSSSRWSHWGTLRRDRLDIPVHEVIGMWQQRILSQMLNTLTLTRLHDSELKLPPGEDAFTAAELLERLSAAIFSELEEVKEGEYTNREPAIHSLRRNLQRSYLESLSNLALGNTRAPHDCSAVAASQLKDIDARIKSLQKRNKVKLDTYSRVHLDEASSRIQKVLDARLALARP